jgi:ribose transport system permease protein
LLSTSVQVGVEGGDRARHRTIRGDESMSPSKRRSRRSRRAVFGRYIYAVGSNPESALLAGVPVTKVLVAVYAIGGLLTAVSGILFASRLNAGIPTAGTGYELNAIATCVIDGRASSARRAAPTGRRPALIVETLNNGGNLLDINSFYLQIITGAGDRAAANSRDPVAGFAVNRRRGVPLGHAATLAGERRPSLRVERAPVAPDATRLMRIALRAGCPAMLQARLMQPPVLVAAAS